MRLKLENICKSFGKKDVLKNINLEIESGKLTSFLGPSGCGKTTLLRIIAGLEKPDRGRIFFDDVCVFSKDENIDLPTEKRGLGFVFQDFSLWPHMTVYDNVAFGLKVKGDFKNIDKKVKSALKKVRLEGYEKRYPSMLSGGEQQRVSFARAIVIMPGCILFDEPLSALDAILRKQMRLELRELINELSITGIFVTHDQTEAMSMSEKIAVFHNGFLEQYDTPYNIYNHPNNEFVASFIGLGNWIKDDLMFRPEVASLNDFEGAKTFNTIVSKVQFLGNSYLLNVNHNEKTWSIFSNERLDVGDKLTIHIDEKNFIKI
ncbi:iron(III) transport system ATP-binding protein [Peptoniphilus koenoeneniae]|uniref:Iron(III) transport system ATP-binding protein n=1 Tax=Peptoniphilus koenoeneniae TaxID=507751 RepID=A0ABU0ATA9_9FIRM|nr:MULTISPECIES: ABC transporter ATP-binding protein [Peptoniphilus]ERT59097.1 ABC transporter, ATP-binding protein [Peptoniphilus sp. BV3C26]MDQ0274513.1 iron(III) transport system ATP-binding protein [Peptoniphilus koenoeneniae]